MCTFTGVTVIVFHCHIETFFQSESQHANPDVDRYGVFQAATNTDY